MHDKGGAMAALGFALAAAMLTCADGALIKVGGKRGWKPNVNYTFWAAHQHFYVGDWLYFVFDKRYYNVLEVTKWNYERCKDEKFIKNITRGGRDVYNLTEARAYYFLSGGGYCFGGMKLSVHVHRPPPPPPPPTAAPDMKSTKNGASPGTEAERMAVLLLLLMAAVSTSIFNFL